MDAFLHVLRKHGIKQPGLRRGRLATLQVNMGNLCNQACRHCHIEGSPAGRKVMPGCVVEQVLRLLARARIKTLDITGGAPELNANFERLVAGARSQVTEIVVRSNLTVLLEAGKEHLPAFFKTHRVHLIGSLPCYTKQNVDRQRGSGAFAKSIAALRLLNAQGFGGAGALRLDLAYNPLGGALPAPQQELERDYKRELRRRGVAFDRLLSIANMPIRRFRRQLESRGEFGRYNRLLETSFNPRTLKSVMCRTFLSVGHDGRLYDCDFNLALGMALKDPAGAALAVDGLRPTRLEGREIMTGGHCLACTAGSGSSCRGALAG